MGSPDIAQRMRQMMIKVGNAGWQRVALLCIVILAGVGTNVVNLFLTGAPRALAASNAIQIENSFPGDPTWNDFSANLAPDALSGYSSPITVNHGGTVDFYVTTTSASVTIDIYRTGWYGGTGARHMETLGTYTGQHQAIPNPDPVNGMVACNWQKTASLAIPSSWTTGVYVAKLTGSSGDKSLILFVVRNDGGHEDFVFQTSITTYQAYNAWGGTSLYNNLTNGSVYKYAHATKVSFDRPFNPGDGNGLGHYLWFEYPMVRWAEKNGFDMTYTTDVDTDMNTNPLTNHKAFFSVGHDEYWSKNMRDNVQAAINAGVNMGFFNGNSAYWQIRLEPNAAGMPDRVEVGYKDFATTNTAPGPDPQWGVNNAVVTTLWRDPLINKPENGLMGVMFMDQNKSVERPYVITNASNWIFANTGFVNGSSVPGIVGYEYDATYSNGFTPAGLTVLSVSPVDGMNGTSNANSTIYTAPSGARVFAAGTIAWSYGLDNYGGRSTANAGIQQATTNIFYNFNGGTPPPPPPPPPAGTYLQDNFESGNLTQWTGPIGTGSAGVATGAVVHNGSYSAQLTTPSGSGQYVTLTKALVNSPGANTFTRFYFQITNPGVSATLASATDTNGNNMWSVLYDNGSHGLDIFFWNSARARFDFYSKVNSVQPNTWYGLEINMNEVTAGSAQIWLDGVSIGTISGNLSATNTIANLNLWDDAAGTTNYFDDIKVSNAYNGTVAAGGGATSFTPSGLTFGLQATGTTSAAQSVTLTNTSGSTINVVAVGVTGANTTDFSISADTCTGTALAVNASCTVSAKFAPTTTGSRTAMISFYDNAPASPQSVVVSGTGVLPGPIASISPASLTFTNQGVGSTSATQTITMTNTGTASMSVTSIAIGGTNPTDFTKSADTCTGATVAIGATCSVSIAFAPTARGTRTATVSFTDNAPGSPQTVALTGSGVQLLPAGVYLQEDFESGSLGSWWSTAGTGTPTVQNTVANSGAYSLAMTNAAGQYVIASQYLTGGAQAHTFTRLYFRITNASVSSTMASASDSNGNNLWAVLYDAGSHGLDVYFWNGARTRFDFYTTTNLVQANTWYSLEIELNEATTGQGNVWLNGTALGGVTGDLSATNALTRIYLWNDAASTTTYFDDVIVSNQYNGPLGSVPGIGFNPTSVSFGNQGVGVTSAAKTVTVTNTGTATLHITSASLTGANAADYLISANTCNGAALTPGKACSVSLTFTPGAGGTRTASLSFADDAPASPQTVAISGTGVVPAPAISFNPTSVSFSSQNVGSTSGAQTITVTNSGSASLHITSVTLGGTNAGDFTKSADTCTGATVAVNATCSVSVTFTPTATGTRTASLSFADDAPASPQTVAISGTGAQAGNYLQDGFESGNLSAWSVAGTGAATVEGTVVNRGTHALAMTNGAGQYTILSQNLTGGAQAHTFTRLYFQVSNASVSSTVAVATDSGGNNLWAVIYDAGSHGLDVYFWNGARTRFDFYSKANLIQSNTWYALEIELNEATTGQGNVWLNGTALGGVTGDLSATNNLSRLYLWNDAASTTTYFDDVIISSQYNGLLP